MVARLVVGATRSSDGKTTVASGVMAALRARGLVVSPHKVGPDYIDPGYHAAATGRPGRNLDVFMVGEEQVAPLFLHGSAGADVAVVEGVMGLFDGVTGQAGRASTAHVAQLLAAPVVLVVSAAGAGRSVAAVVRGFASFDPAVRIGGVVLNQVASDRHERILRDAFEGEGTPVLGALRRDPALRAPSRHLGLVPAAERGVEVGAWLPALAAAVERDVDLDALLAVARAAGPLPGVAWQPPAGTVGAGLRVAVAAGSAFTFSYPEHVEMLTALGAEVVSFDPLTSRLPAGTDALVVGGGFPEVYAGELAANEPLRAEVAARVAAGMPVVAECAGLLWLADTLDGAEQVGAVATDAVMSPRLTLGYRTAVALADSPVTAAGERVRGHEFHRTVVSPTAGDTPAWRFDDGTEHGWASPGLLASYLHLHWAGLDDPAGRLLAAARAARTPRTPRPPRVATDVGLSPTSVATRGEG